MTGVDLIGVVVPARDEEELLPRCLAALRVAALAVRGAVAVEVLVVLDSCRDDSAAVVARAEGVRGMVVSHSNVGAARRSGFGALVDRHDPRRLWLAGTDADSEVPPDWLRTHLAAARRGWDALVGTVVVRDWGGHPRHARSRYLRGYTSSWGHPHVHGANFGVHATGYLRVGGVPALRSGEDVALVAALGRAGCRVLRSPEAPVVTSARRRGRADAGFAEHLAALGRPA